MISTKTQKTSTPSKLSSAKNCWNSVPFNSALIWIALTVVFVDIVTITMKPMRFVKIPGVILKQQDHIDDKLNSIIVNSKNFNVLMLGTSLAEAVAVNADATLLYSPMSIYDVLRYTEARYLDGKLNEELGIRAKTFSFAVGGSMVSDALLVLKKVLEESKKPKLVILLVAPQSIMDTTRKTELNPVECYLKWRYKEIPKLGDLSATVDFILSKVWGFYKYRSDLSTALTKFVDSCKALEARDSRRITISFADEIHHSEQVLEPHQVEDTYKYYQDAYKYIDQEKVNLQFKRLSELITECKDNGIELVVVTAPQAKKNRLQLPEGFAKVFKKRMDDTCTTFGAKLVKLFDNSEFQDTDYIDYVHLNSNGAVKFCDSVSAELSKDSEFVRKLGAKFK